MIRHPKCEVYERVEGEPETTHGPMSRTAAHKLFRRRLRELQQCRPRVQYRIGWRDAGTEAPAHG